MKLKYVLSLLVITLFAWLTLTTNEQTAAQTQGQENLLSNPGFEAGHHHQGGFAEITVPDGWTLH
jgi:hypothetical protein